MSKQSNYGKILFLTTVLPSQLQMGSEVASQSYIDGLSRLGYDVQVVGYMRKDDRFKPTPQEIVVDYRYIETKRAKFYVVLWMLLSFWLHLPYSAAKYYSKTYIRKVKQLLQVHQYAAVIIDHPQLGWLVPYIPTHVPLITISHNIEHEIYQSNVSITKNFISRLIYQREARLIKHMEDTIAVQSQELWALTDHDANYFASLDQNTQVRVFALPPGFSKQQTRNLEKQFDIGLIGSWAWKPNREGLEWFLQAVYPLLPSDLSIHIAGKGADSLLSNYPNIRYCGFVPDAQEFMAQAQVMAIPTLSGGGIQIKTLDAIASGSRIVATPIALRGITHPPATVQVTQQPEEFANLLDLALHTPVSQQLLEETSRWFDNRCEHFLSDLTSAMDAVAASTVDTLHASASYIA